MKADQISTRLIEKGLKVTPQRIAVYEAITRLNHPAAEKIVEFIRKNNPHISVATVYKILDALVDHDLIKRVKTDNDVMRYDAVMESHHHIYCTDSERIEDYMDENLNKLLAEYFGSDRIPGFKIEDIKLQIIGTYTKRNQ